MTGKLNPLRLFIEITLLLALVEGGLMLLLPRLFADLSGLEAALADALALALISGSLIFWRLRHILQESESSFAAEQRLTHAWRWALLVLLAGFALTGWRVHVMHAELVTQANERFQRLGSQLESDLLLRFERTVQVLRGARSLFDAYPGADRQAFRQWLAARDLAREAPGVRGIGFFQPVPAAQLPALIRSEHQQGAPDFALKGVGGAPIDPVRPYIIRFVEPVANNRAAVGLDISSEANRKHTADLSAETGEALLTGVITLLQDERKRPGALLMLPVYRGAIPATAQARQAALYGWVYAPLVFEELLTDARNSLYDLVAYELRHLDAAGKETTLFTTTAQANAGPRRLTASRRLYVYGQTYIMNVTATATFDEDFAWSSATRLGFAGVLISTLVALSLWLLLTGRNRALAQARELTTSMRDAYRLMEVATQRVEAVLLAAPVGVLIVDTSGRIVLCNPAAERIFGYLPGELISTRIGQLVPVDARHGHDSKMAGYMAAPTARRMGGTRRLSARRKDGADVPVEVGLNPLRVAGESTILVTVIDISERAQAEDELEHHRHHLEELVSARTADAVRAKEIAERANAAKTRFLTNMSHELRTPLHAMLSFARLGQKRAAAADGVPPKLVQYFQKIAEGGARLHKLVEALMDLSALELGQRQFLFAALDVRTLIHDALAAAQDEATGKAIRFVAELPEGELMATLDRENMHTVLAHLLHNAITYSPVGAEVRIRAALDTAAAPALCIEISDRGIGIPEDELETVFDPFVQSSQTATGAGGTGLGLAICRDIVNAHGGQISACANSGGGTRFTITLPLQPPPLPAMAATLR